MINTMRKWCSTSVDCSYIQDEKHTKQYVFQNGAILIEKMRQALLVGFNMWTKQTKNEQYGALQQAV